MIGLHVIFFVGYLAVWWLLRFREWKVSLLLHQKSRRWFFLFGHGGNLAGVFASLRKNTESDHTGLTLAFFGLISGLCVIILLERERKEQERKRQEGLLILYPEFVMKLTLLLRAGLTVRNAFGRMAAQETLRRQSASRELQRCLTASYRELESGRSEREVYLNFGERCGQARYRMLALLLTQNLQKGTSMLLPLLEREARAAWEERRRKAKTEGEQAVTKLLLPMMLLLVVVMAVILVPAFLSFYGVIG